MRLTKPAGWALALTSVAFFMTALDTLVVITALPAIHASLGGSVSTLEWTVNAYTLTLAAGIITAAALGDRFGRRRMYVAGLLLFTAASAACALAPSAGMLIGARAIQGLGAALITPLSLTILASAFPAERRGAIVGIMGAIGGLAIAGGPLVGGAVVGGPGWHWIFWLNVPVGLAAAALAMSKLPESRGPAVRIDLPGVALASAGAVALAWGLVRTTDVGWGSPQVIGALIVAAVLIAGFIAWERRASEPMLPLRLLRIPAFAAANAERLHDVRQHHLGRLLDGAVLPAGTWLLAHSNRPALPAVDPHPAADRPGGRRTRRQDRIAAADGHRPGHAGERAGVDRARRDEHGRLRPVSCYR
jgi:EmrB/QacA subfamily drug resistance transporter